MKGLQYPDFNCLDIDLADLATLQHIPHVRTILYPARDGVIAGLNHTQRGHGKALKSSVMRTSTSTSQM